MPKKNDHDHGHEHEDEPDLESELDELGGELSMPLELEAASQMLIEMRAQNVELIRIAAQVAGYAGEHGPLKPGELRQAMNSIWDIYSQIYQWIDPEDSGEGDEDDDEDEE
jgi:hypothetical protein